MKLPLAFTFLFVLECPWADGTPSTSKNVVVTKFYEPVVVHEDPRKPKDFWIYVNDSCFVYDTYGIINGTDAIRGKVMYEPRELNADLVKSPDAYYVSSRNKSVPLYCIPPNWKKGGADNSTLIAMPQDIVPRKEKLFSTSPIDDIAAITVRPNSTIVVPVDTVSIFKPVNISRPLSVQPDDQRNKSGRNDTEEIEDNDSDKSFKNSTGDDTGKPFKNSTGDDVSKPFKNYTGDDFDKPFRNSTGDDFGKPFMNSTGDDIGKPFKNSTGDDFGKPFKNSTVESEVSSGKPFRNSTEATRDFPGKFEGTNFGVSADFPNKPDWWDVIESSVSMPDLGECKKRNNTAPSQGQNCQRESKTCFFGNKSCPRAPSYPETECMCRNKKWSCYPAACP